MPQKSDKISRRSFGKRAVAAGIGLVVFSRNAKGQDGPMYFYVNNNGLGDPNNPNYDPNIYPANSVDSEGIQGRHPETPFETVKYALQVAGGFGSPPEIYIQQPGQPLYVDVSPGIYTQGFAIKPYQTVIGASKVKRLVPAITGQHIPDPHSDITTLFVPGITARNPGPGGSTGPKTIQTCHIRFSDDPGKINAECGETTLDGCFIEGYQNLAKANNKWWAPSGHRNNMDYENNLIKHCIIAGMGIGIGLGNASGVRMMGNQFLKNYISIQVDGGELDLSGNKPVKSFTEGEEYDGGNIFVDSTSGIHIENSSSSTLPPIIGTEVGWTDGELVGDNPQISMLTTDSEILTKLNGLDIYYGSGKAGDLREIDVGNPMTEYPFESSGLPSIGAFGKGAVAFGIGASGISRLVRNNEDRRTLDRLLREGGISRRELFQRIVGRN